MPRPSARLIQLEYLLHQGFDPSLEEICAALDMTSTRHARRLIGQLRANGVPVQDRREDRIKRFFLALAHRKPSTQGLGFDEEMLGLAVAAEAAKAALTETPLGDPLDRAFRKLLDQLAPAAYTIEEESIAPAGIDAGS